MTLLSDPSLREPAMPSPGAIAEQIEAWLDRSLPPSPELPEVLHRALRYAVFAGGKRLRPQLLVQIAVACGARPAELELALRAACAVDLVHTASLVRDDLPCFDDATERRGQPALHVVFGEPMAVLAGDALIAQGFEVLAAAPRSLAPRALRILHLLARATGARSGLSGAPASDSSGPAEHIQRYHSVKTGGLFTLAAEAAAVAVGSAKGSDWAEVGQLVGRCYHLAYDLTELRRRAESASEAAPKRPEPELRGAVLSQVRESARAQLDALLATIRERVRGLAATPEPLLQFLDSLRCHALQSAGLPTTTTAATTTVTAAAGPAIEAAQRPRTRARSA